jgi:hypothetical protein
MADSRSAQHQLVIASVVADVTIGSQISQDTDEAKRKSRYEIATVGELCKIFSLHKILASDKKASGLCTHHWGSECMRNETAGCREDDLHRPLCVLYNNPMRLLYRRD